MEQPYNPTEDKLQGLLHHLMIDTPIAPDGPCPVRMYVASMNMSFQIKLYICADVAHECII